MRVNGHRHSKPQFEPPFVPRYRDDRPAPSEEINRYFYGYAEGHWATSVMPASPKPSLPAMPATARREQ